MNPDRAVTRINQDWEYKTDGKIDRWGFTTPGDCENYALRVLSLIAGGDKAAYKMLMSRDAYIWYVKTLNGNGHAVLEYDGRFVDNRLQRWVSDLDYMRLQDNPRRRYSRFEISIKMMFGIKL